MATYQWLIGIIGPLLAGSVVANFKLWADGHGYKISYEREKEATDAVREEMREAKFMRNMTSAMAEAFRQVAAEQKKQVS